jgi:hypothetical protein
MTPTSSVLSRLALGLLRTFKIKATWLVRGGAGLRRPGVALS